MLSKLVLGLPYHGYAWTLVDPKDNAMGAPALGRPGPSLKPLKQWLEVPKLGRPQIFKNPYYINPLLINSSIKKFFPAHW